MAGPTVAILVKEILDAEAKGEILAFVKSIASEYHGNDFWVSGAPMGFYFGPEYPCEIEEYSELAKLIGWEPKDQMGLYAMCNGDQDHIVLGQVTLRIAKMTNGYIAFRDVLQSQTSDTYFLRNTGIYNYKNESILNVTAFETWLKHPDFKMVK